MEVDKNQLDWYWNGSWTAFYRLIDTRSGIPNQTEFKKRGYRI